MPQHKQEVILARRQQVAALYLTGRYQSEIAAIVGVTQPQISADLAALRKQWLASSLRDFDTAIAEELKKVDRVEIEYWRGWERSLTDRVQTLAEVTHGEKPSRKHSRRREGQAGDPRFLDGVLQCVKRRCALLGLNAPTKVAVEWDALSVAQLERLAGGERPREVLLAEA